MCILAIANRKGGVGKSTVATMIAYSLVVWGKQQVLLVDLDAQCNASLILFGGNNWKVARDKGQTIADFFGDRFEHQRCSAKDYVCCGVGDVASGATKASNISLLPGSVDLEDIEHELLHKLANTTRNLYDAEQGVIGRFGILLREFRKEFPVIIFDCPPGLSFATQAALKIADKIIVPFRPDYVSAFAVDRISRMIEAKPSFDDVRQIPRNKRRYISLANFVSEQDVAALERIEEIEDYHPLMNTRIPIDHDIANALNWRKDRVSIETKFGKNGAKIARSLFKEVKTLLS